jgi:membrane-associated protease RseP (regulator of RpoE activity)
MRREFDRLLDAMTKANTVPQADIDELKRSVFGYGTFWVTGTEPSTEWPGGVLFRGNVRGGDGRGAAFATIMEGVRKAFGDKYVVFITEEPPLSLFDAAPEAPPPAAGAAGAPPEPRAAFVVVPSALAAPAPTSGLQTALAGLLVLLTLAASVELGLEAQLAQLPRETLDYFASPGALDALPPGGVIPGLDAVSPAALLAAAAPISAGVLAVAAAHEAGHAAAAKARGVTLGPPFLIPNGSLGTFGAVTQIKSVLPNRTHLFDVAAAGPLAGGAAAAALFLYGLAASASSGGALPAGEGAEAARAAALAAGLVPVPQALFQGSLLLGGVARTVLASGAATAGARELFVHPAFVAGWCGLTATALNCLPLGCTDGGRMALAAWGRPRLTLLSAASYVGLALGLLAGPLSLSWGLYVLLVQRSPERAPLDGLTPTDERRANLALALMLAAAGVLLPLELPPL